MSKNFPNDNIYSIIGKLEALKPTPEEKRFALVKEIRESVEAQGSILEGVDSVQAKLAKEFAESKLDEKAVSQAQQKFMGMVHAAQKGEKAASPEVAKVAKDMKKKDAKDFASTKHAGLPQHVEEEGAKPDFLDLDKDGNKEEPMKKAAAQVDEAGETCNECGMVESECSCDHTNEAEITRKPGVTTHRKTDFPGYPVDDINADNDEPRGRGRPRKHAVKAPTGLGRGRPTKPKAPTYSKQADPFGRISGAVPKGTKGTIHSLDEAMKQVEESILAEGRYLEDGAGETLNHILNRFRAEVRNFEQGGDLDNDLYDALFDYYSECGEMPYGVQKARTGDPMRWVAEKLDAELGDIAYGKDPANAEGMEEGGIPGNLPADQIPGKEDLLKGKGRSYYEEDSLEEELSELAKLAGLSEESRGQWLKTKAAGEPTVDAFGQKDIPVPGNASKAEVDEEESPKADKDYDQDGEVESEKDEVIGSRRKAAGLDESAQIDGEQSDFNISTNMSADGDKSVTVTATGEHAAGLLQMLRMAGLGNSETAQSLEQDPEVEVVSVEPATIEMDEEGIDVDQPAEEPANAPDETYGSIKNITTQGDDLNREKSQDPATANKAANPLTNAQNVLKAVAQLESKLAEEYESIKKVSK